MKLKVGSDFSGVGAFNQALNLLLLDYEEIFACDMDKFARQTFIHNYGEPAYYPTDVYEREIPTEPLDLYMTSPPCQAFSLAGKRLGKEDGRGVLFFNSHEFIRVNRPRFFIFENVKGLISHDKRNKKDKTGETFKEWLALLGGKSVNGKPVDEPHEDAVPYHIYWKVLNAKNYGVPQNRERVFIIGIRDDVDNVFQWPAEMPLRKKLRDVLEHDVTEKYFLSEKLVNTLLNTSSGKDGCFKPATPKNLDGVANTLTARMAKMGRSDNYLKIKSATKSGFEIATENDSINFSVPNSETRLGRVGKEVAQTLDTACSQGVLIGVHPTSKKLEFDGFKDRVCPTLLATDYKAPKCICVPVLTPEIIQLNNPKHSQQRVYSTEGIAPTLSAGSNGGGQNPVKHLTRDYRIRRLTPRECFRLMGFPDSFTWPVSDSQAYKQAGNSIVAPNLAAIIAELPLYRNI